MEIIHHVSLGVDAAAVDAFRGSGLDLCKHLTDPGFAAFDIAESDPRWPGIRSAAQLADGSYVSTTRFSISELKKSAFNTVYKTWDNGYPQPEDDFKNATYDLSNYCSACGTGLVQARPFRMKDEPRWGRRLLMCLNWIGDEIFTTPELWQSLFRPFGVEHREVLKHKTGQPLETCVQLRIEATASLDIPGTHPSEYCPVCKVTRWNIFHRGFFPKPTADTKAAMFKSSQYFGTGQMAYKHVLVSQALFREIGKLKVRGIEFAACEQ